jgi:hypothetical protein
MLFPSPNMSIGMYIPYNPPWTDGRCHGSTKNLSHRTKPLLRVFQPLLHHAVRFDQLPESPVCCGRNHLCPTSRRNFPEASGDYLRLLFLAHIDPPSPTPRAKDQAPYLSRRGIPASSTTTPTMHFRSRTFLLSRLHFRFAKHGWSRLATVSLVTICSFQTVCRGWGRQC